MAESLAEVHRNKDVYEANVHHVNNMRDEASTMMDEANMMREQVEREKEELRVKTEIVHQILEVLSRAFLNMEIIS